MDNATPSGNSVAAFALLKLGLLTGKENYQRYATTILRLLADQVRRYPSAFSWALCALDFYLSKPKEVAVMADSASADFTELTRTVWQTYLPNRVIALSVGDRAQASKFVPLLAGKEALGGQTTAFVCEAYTCQAPVQTPEELQKQLTSSTR